MLANIIIASLILLLLLGLGVPVFLHVYRRYNPLGDISDITGKPVELGDFKYY